MVKKMAYDFTKEQLLSAIKGSGGIIQEIARRLGTTWYTAERYLKSGEEIQEAYREEKEALLDLAESKVIASISSGNTQDAKWYLGIQGKNRGYGEKMEIEHSGAIDSNVQINITPVKANND